MLGGHFAMQGNQTNFTHLARLVSVMELWCFVSLVTWSMINTSLAPANYYLWNYPKVKQGDDKLYIYWGGRREGIFDNNNWSMNVIITLQDSNIKLFV